MRTCKQPGQMAEIARKQMLLALEDAEQTEADASAE